MAAAPGSGDRADAPRQGDRPGVGIPVGRGRLGGMPGLAGTGHGTIGKIIGDLQHVGEPNAQALTIAVSVLVVIVGAEKISPEIP